MTLVPNNYSSSEFHFRGVSFLSVISVGKAEQPDERSTVW